MADLFGFFKEQLYVTPAADPDPSCQHLSATCEPQTGFGRTFCNDCGTSPRLDVVLNNWFAELRRLTGRG